MLIFTIVTIFFISSLVIFQTIYFLQRRTDRGRLLFLFLLLFLLVHNIFLLNSHFNFFHFRLVTEACKLAEFAMALYYAFFFVKVIRINSLRILFPANAILLLSATPLAVLAVAPSLFPNASTFNHTQVTLIPLTFGAFLIFCMSRFVFIQLKGFNIVDLESSHRKMLFAGYISLLGWAFFPLLSFINIPAYLLLTNISFIVAIVIYIDNTISVAAVENLKSEKLKNELGRKELEVMELKTQLQVKQAKTLQIDCEKASIVYNFTDVELKILKTLIVDEKKTYKEIASEVCLSESRVKQIMSSMKEKTGSKHTIQLVNTIYKLSLS
jgi:DNA-binding CsgD family transcriptional regulator